MGTEYLGRAHDIRIFTSDFEAVPADFFEFVDFVTNELVKHSGEAIDFSDVEIEFVADPYSPAHPGIFEAGTIRRERRWPWENQKSVISLSIKDKNNAYWKTSVDTAFAHELILHWFSKDYERNAKHSDVKLQLLLDTTINNWKVHKQKEKEKRNA